MKIDIFHYQLKDLFAIIDSESNFANENNEIINSANHIIEKYNCDTGHSYDIPC